jgi:hypothetical protein
LSGLTDDHIDRIAEDAVERTNSPGTFILRMGEKRDTAFIQKNCKVQTLLEKPGSYAVQLTEIKPGEVFGDIALLVK